MKCACCGKRKGLFESFEVLDKQVNVCVECSKKLYKYQDFKREKDDAEAQKILSEIKGKRNTDQFTAWLEAFILRIEPKKNNADSSVKQAEVNSTESKEE